MAQMRIKDYGGGIPFNYLLKNGVLNKKYNLVLRYNKNTTSTYRPFDTDFNGKDGDYYYYSTSASPRSCGFVNLSQEVKDLIGNKKLCFEFRILKRQDISAIHPFYYNGYAQWEEGSERATKMGEDTNYIYGTIKFINKSSYKNNVGLNNTQAYFGIKNIWIE